MNGPYIVVQAQRCTLHPRDFYVEGLPFEKVYTSTYDQAVYIADAMNKAYEAGRQAHARELP